MDPDVRRAIDLIDEAQAWLRRQGPVELSADYLESVRRAEMLPANVPRADKSHVEKALRAFLRDYSADVGPPRD